MLLRLRAGNAVVLLMAVLCVMAGLVVAGNRAGRAAAASDTPAPSLITPAANLILSTMAFDLSWHGVASATQYHVQVTPYNNDGPGINVIRGAETSLVLPLPDPVFGPFILLPDMTYRWRVRASTKATSADEGDGSWGAWSEERPFRTPRLPDLGTRVLDPLEGAQVSPGPIRFRWGHSDPAIYYWEVQVSKEPSFDTSPSTGPSFVWWNLIHGGVSNPRNSWLSPELPAGVYYWRVRPRVQGDGRPGVWSATIRFTVAGPAASATPSASGTPIASPTATATPPAVARTFGFESNRSGNFELYAMPVNASGPRALTSNQAHERMMQWSPDGTKIAFLSDREASQRVYTMNADGSGLKGGEGADHFAWSPDSSRLAVADVTQGVRIYYPGLTLFKTLVEPGAFSGFAGMSWAPDSQKLAVSARSGTNPDHTIYVYTWKNGVVSKDITGGMGDNIEPVFQKAFFRISYVSDRAGAYDIWDGNDAGQGIVNITQYEGPESQMSWSPTSNRLLFVRGAGHQADIWTMNPDGTNQVNLTSSPGEDTDPVWSPDGQQILFTSSRDGNTEVYLMHADGAHPTNLTLNPAIDRKPTWFPK